MGQSVHDVDAMSLHQFAVLARGWRIAHQTEEERARLSPAQADDLFAYITSPDYVEG